MLWVVKECNWLPRVVAESSSPKILRTQLDLVLNSLLDGQCLRGSAGLQRCFSKQAVQGSVPWAAHPGLLLTVLSCCRRRGSLVPGSAGVRALRCHLPPPEQSAPQGEARSPRHCLCVEFFLHLDHSTNSWLEQLHPQ